MMGLRPFKLDLHVHSVLSPCGELEMGLSDIARQAAEVGLDGLALTDHNACANAAGLIEAAQELGLWVIPGCEVQTEEDIHVVCLFPTLGSAMDFQGWTWNLLNPVANDPDVFGYQLVVDKEGNILDQVDTLLVQGIRAGVDQVLLEVRQRGGITILSHVDRPSFSYPAVLGPIPPDLPVDAIEISWRASDQEAERIRRSLPHLPFLRSSDSHCLSHLSAQRCTTFLMGDLSFPELRLALKGQEGRGILAPYRFPSDLEVR